MQRKYIQMEISSTEGISKELVGILSARTDYEMFVAMGANREFWIEIFKMVDQYDFSHLHKYHTYSHISNYSYMTLPAALGLIPNFAAGSNAYGTPEKQERKFKQLLNALSFLDCDLYVTLLLKRFKWSLVESLIKENNNGEQ